MKPLLLAGAAAFAGIIGLAVIFPRVDPSAAVRLTLDRKQAIERVRKLSSRYGVETAGWRAAVTDRTNPKLKAYLAAYPDDPAAKLFSVLDLRVALIAPDGKRSVQAVLSADGRPVEWTVNGAGGAPAIEAILSDFADANLRYFAGGAASEDDEGVSTRNWKWSNGERFPLAAELVIKQKGGSLLSAALTPDYQPRFDQEYTQARSSTLMYTESGLIATMFLAALCFCLWNWLRRKRQWRIPLVLASVYLIWAAFSTWFGTDFQVAIQSRLPHSDMPPGQNLAGIVVDQLLLVIASFVCGVGLAIGTAGIRDGWRSLQLVCRGRIFNRAVGTSLAMGMLSGIGIAVVPYLLAATKWFPGALLSFRYTDALVAPVPATVALQMRAAIPGLLLFGFLFPVTHRLRYAPLRWAAFVSVGVLVVAKSMPFETAAPGVAAAAVVFGAYLLLYVYSDLLAVVTGMIAARAVIVPCVLLGQPAPSARESAFWLLTLGMAAVVTSVYWAVRGREPDAQPEAYPTRDAEAIQKPDRERLQAEFQVARKAQQDALPAGAPAVNGYSLAGWCEPALQVGGDLYGYFPLPDGRLGVAVADVSGKGVPAALYMMVTKGLLSAVTRDSSGLAYILEQINLHLYRACRRKVFVTMAAVVLDPSSRRVQYGRAGHNPVVWRRVRLDGTALVKPRGLGLGMTRAERFARILAIEDLDLESGDAIVLYSDGITEAVNEAMEQFGEERLMRSVESTDGQSATESQAAILRDLARFMGATPPRDDITLVVIRAA